MVMQHKSDNEFLTVYDVKEPKSFTTETEKLILKIKIKKQMSHSFVNRLVTLLHLPVQVFIIH